MSAVVRPLPEESQVTAEPATALPNVGVVAIGRNEGERLKRCLESVLGVARQVVYVDSGSTDGSVAMARAMGAAVVELDTRIPFAPGRARNEGFRALCELYPSVTYVQFVDGDCEVVAGWLGKAAAFLDAHPDIAIVSGRRCERYPERSVYNLLCAIEWDTHPVGEARFCGGDALVRADAFAAARGYRPDLMAGEEPELCQRLRAAGWRIWFLEDALTLHDAAMLRFGQWWKRAMRSGYGVMQRACLCGVPRGEFRGVRDFVGTWLWALVLPVGIVVLAFAWSPWAALLLFLYPLQALRLALLGEQTGPDALRRNLWYAVFLVLAKFPKLLGQLKFLTHHYIRRAPRLIEYKS